MLGLRHLDVPSLRGRPQEKNATEDRGQLQQGKKHVQKQDTKVITDEECTKKGQCVRKVLQRTNA
jgi:hypothetical protein